MVCCAAVVVQGALEGIGGQQRVRRNGVQVLGTGERISDLDQAVQRVVGMRRGVTARIGCRKLVASAVVGKLGGVIDAVYELDHVAELAVQAADLVSQRTPSIPGLFYGPIACGVESVFHPIAEIVLHRHQAVCGIVFVIDKGAGWLGDAR